MEHSKARVRVWRQPPGTGEVRPHTAREKLLQAQMEKQVENLAQTITDMAEEKKQLAVKLNARMEDLNSLRDENSVLRNEIIEREHELDTLEGKLEDTRHFAHPLTMANLAHALNDYEQFLDDTFRDYIMYQYKPEDIERYIKGAYHPKLPEGFRDIFEYREAARRGIENIREFDPDGTDEV